MADHAVLSQPDLVSSLDPGPAAVGDPARRCSFTRKEPTYFQKEVGGWLEPPNLGLVSQALLVIAWVPTLARGM